MLRSNLSVRADAEAWAVTFLSLLIFALHALASNALNLIVPHIPTSSILESPWLPNGKIFGAAALFQRLPRACARGYGSFAASQRVNNTPSANLDGSDHRPLTH